MTGGASSSLTKATQNDHEFITTQEITRHAGAPLVGRLRFRSAAIRCSVVLTRQFPRPRTIMTWTFAPSQNPALTSANRDSHASTSALSIPDLILRRVADNSNVILSILNAARFISWTEYSSHAGYAHGWFFSKVSGVLPEYPGLFLPPPHLKTEVVFWISQNASIRAPR
jgi:hypothetical protein